jgi:hypothetical protein
MGQWLGQMTYQEYLEPYLQRVQTWQLKFAMWPRRCAKTNQWIWFETAYRGTRIITGPGSSIVEYFWMSRTEFVIWRLKSV